MMLEWVKQSVGVTGYWERHGLVYFTILHFHHMLVIS